MSKIKVGSVVKFTDSEGRLDGGTVIDFLRKDNQECLLINSLEGKKIVKKRVEVSLIQRQQRGRVAASFLVDMKEEFDKANKEAGLGIIPMEEKTEEVKLNIISSKQQSQKDGGSLQKPRLFLLMYLLILKTKLRSLQIPTNYCNHRFKRRMKRLLS